EDLPVYLDAGCKTTAQMRIITFPLKERAVLIPIELVETIKPFLIIAPLLFLFAAIAGPLGVWTNAASFGLFAFWAFLCAIIGGAVLNPLLLPYLPGRAFSMKGFSIGMVISLILLYLRDINLSAWTGRMEALAWLLIIPAVSGYLAMNFTGASTYTSLSGVKKEMRWALPLEIACGVVGLVIWIGAILIY
ncbi:MAG: mercury methylation corrinoid protein HgcA, partial [Smithella sp.]